MVVTHDNSDTSSQPERVVDDGLSRGTHRMGPPEVLRSHPRDVVDQCSPRGSRSWRKPTVRTADLLSTPKWSVDVWHAFKARWHIRRSGTASGLESMFGALACFRGPSLCLNPICDRGPRKHGTRLRVSESQRSAQRTLQLSRTAIQRVTNPSPGSSYIRVFASRKG
jgi:hypothetical protein